MDNSLLNYDYIKGYITTNEGEDVPYRWSHGATEQHLGDGLIIYTLINFFKLKTLVCLGSGGGYIPRIMTQARYDLSQEGFYNDVTMEWGDNGSTYIVDACNGFNGEVDWEDKDSVFRRHFTPKFIKETTETAYHNYFVKQDIKIDLLHIDANHTFDGVKKDFDLYTTIMNKGGIITIHDTDKSYVENFTEIDGHEGDDLTGPSKFVKTIDKRKFEVFNFFNHGIIKDKPSSTGLTLVRKK
jgi:hypothetical protein|tara:strand:- start:649 stop:1371 length:723 start_codon:yes stop_codon:yes gene_type:complete